MATHCPRCQLMLPEHYANAFEFAPCPQCRSSLLVRTYPALRRSSPEGARPEPPLDEGDSSCFHHPHFRAVGSCDHCGRFLCALCDIELVGEHTCATCLEASIRGGRSDALSNRRFKYDDIVLVLALWTLVLSILGIGSRQWLFIVIAVAFQLASAGAAWKFRAEPQSVVKRHPLQRIGGWLLVGASFILTVAGIVSLLNSHGDPW